MDIDVGDLIVNYTFHNTRQWMKYYPHEVIPYNPGFGSDSSRPYTMYGDVAIVLAIDGEQMLLLSQRMLKIGWAHNSMCGIAS